MVGGRELGILMNATDMGYYRKKEGTCIREGVESRGVAPEI